MFRHRGNDWDVNFRIPCLKKNQFQLFLSMEGITDSISEDSGKIQIPYVGVYIDYSYKCNIVLMHFTFCNT